jgi:U3 small nucleolar RNA-associated protein MPP10
LEFIGKNLYEDSDEEEEDFDPKNLRFDDFFVSDSKLSSSKKVNKREKKRELGNDDDESDVFDENDDGNVADEVEEDDDEDFDGIDDYQGSEDEDNSVHVTANMPKPDAFSTTFQKRSKELASQISELEKELVAEKSWELKGEIKAAMRPENSLLDIAADVDRYLKHSILS